MRRSVVRRALVIVSVGLAIGTGLGIASGRVIASQLVMVEAADPLTMLAIAIALFGIGWMAALLPARQAARTEPAAVLRDS